MCSFAAFSRHCRLPRLTCFVSITNTASTSTCSLHCVISACYEIVGTDIFEDVTVGWLMGLVIISVLMC